MTDNRLERERLQAEALKANLRRRKAKDRAQVAPDSPGEPPPAADPKAQTPD